MKATYMKPSLKVYNIATEDSMLAVQSAGNNFTSSGESDGYQGNIGELGTSQEVDGSSALSRQGSFPGNPWDD